MVRSDTGFNGFCSGISIMTGQHFSDTGVVYHRMTKIPHRSDLNSYTGNAFNQDMREALGALQLYQNSSHLYNYYLDWDYHVQLAEAGQRQQVFKDLRGYVKELSQDFYDQDKDSLNVFGIFLSFGNEYPGGHDIFPYKLSRPFERGWNADTLQVMDPNFPGMDCDIVIEYDSLLAFGYLFGALEYRVWCGTISGSLADFNMAQEADLSSPVLRYPKSNHMKATNYGTSLITAGVCDYEILNQDKPSEKISLDETGIQNSIPGVFRQMIMNSDNIPEAWHSRDELKTQNDSHRV